MAQPALPRSVLLSVRDLDIEIAPRALSIRIGEMYDPDPPPAPSAE
jgi:hypothetical protein